MIWALLIALLWTTPSFGATLLTSRVIALDAENSRMQSPRVNLGALTSEITVRLQRPTSASPLAWDETARLTVTLVFIVDGVEYRCAGSTSGGIRKNIDGTEAPFYGLSFVPPVLFGQKARDYITTQTPDKDGFYYDVPLTRVGELGSTVQGYLVLERLSGTINTVISVAATTEEPAPVLARFHNSVAFDAATNVVESYGDGVVSLSHTASGSDRAAFIGVGIRTATMGVGTTTYAGGGGTITSSFTIESVDFEGGIYGLYKTAPAASAQTVSSDITATTPSDHFLGVITFTGVDQTTPVGTAATTPFAFDTSPSVTVGSVNTDDMVVDFLLDQSAPTVGAGQTERWSPAATSYPTRFRGSTQPGSSGGVMSWTHTGSGSRALGAVAFKAASAGGAAAVPVRMLMGVGL